MKAMLSGLYAPAGKGRRRTTMTPKRRLATLVLLTAFALTPACDLEGPMPVEMIAYDGDGSLLTFMAYGIHVFDTTLNRELRSIPFDGMPISKTLEVYRYSLSADGHTVAVSFPAPFAPPNEMSDRSTIALFDLRTGILLKTFRPEDASPYGRAQGVDELKLSPQADLIFARSVDGTSYGNRFHVVVFDVATGLQLWQRNVERDLQIPIFSQDGAVLFVENDSPRRIEALDARTGAALYAVELSRPLWNLCMTADGTLAGVLGPANDQPCPDPGSCPPSTAFWSPADLTSIDVRAWPEQTSTHSSNANNARAAFWCSPWTNLWAADVIDFSKEAQPPVLEIWTTDGTRAQVLDQGTGLNVVTFSPDGQFVATAGFVGAADAVHVFRISDGVLVGTLNYRWELL
jgi:hypothetical protein